VSAGLSDDRRQAVRDARDQNGNPFINGIDFLEVDPADETKLVVYFIFNLPDAPNDPVPPNSRGDALTANNILIEGGERITNIGVISANRTADNQLTVDVTEIGDFSIYTLRLIVPATGLTPPGFDPRLCAVNFLFHVECAKQFDCKPMPSCPPDFIPPPSIDYLVKDYPGFLRIMLDRMSLLAPGWAERNPADLGVGIVEALAYVADHLSYRQDAIATEAYLGTARTRTSIRRHARLVDYHLGEGCNARAWIRILVNADIPAGIPRVKKIPSATQGAPDTILYWRLCTGFAAFPGPTLPRDTQAYQLAQQAGAQFFEPMADTPGLFLVHNEMPLYNWSDRSSCLAPGATQATLQGSFPNLQAGMVLVLAEAKGPLTGSPDDADPMKRWPVRLTSAGPPSTDPVTGTAVTAITWHAEDALPFPVCVSNITDVAHGQTPITGVSVAWGNIVLADHGRTLGDPLEDMPEAIGIVSSRTTQRFRPNLAETPLTFAAPYPFLGEPQTPLHSALAASGYTAADATPTISAQSEGAAGTEQDWQAFADLLAIDIGPDTAGFVVEVERDGTAYLRFGDGINGMLPEPTASFTANYRVGLGVAGNVGRDSITLIDTTGIDVAVVPLITRATNPLPASGGIEPETIDHVRQSAPYAFRTQQRAVTQDDYRNVAMQYQGVRQAAATFRWTGSWNTVFLTTEREDSVALDSNFIAGLENYVDGYRMAGYDLEVEDATLVPLRVAMHVCVQDGFVATDVESALLTIFSDQVLPDGTLGVFHPDNFDLGQPFYLSPLYARAQAVDGVASVSITRFEREATPGDTTGLTTGLLIPNRLELFVLANDPNYPGRGLFELQVDGGI
jgi:hypothetical protein